MPTASRLALLAGLPALLALLLAGCRDPALATPDPAPATPVVPIAAALGEARLSGAFLLRAASPDGEPAQVLLHDGEGRGDGAIQWDLDLPVSADYTVWLRVKWRDTCGNSITLAAPGLPPIIVGEDAVYGAWHWVQAGPAPLAAGAQTLTLAEREDGVAIAALLLSADPAFDPAVNPLPGLAPSAAAQLVVPDRIAADDFNRSPGHGLGAWTPRSGDWELSFSFDPNRVPLQYALSGRGAPGGLPGVVQLQGEPWLTCRLSFAVLLRDAQRVGALLDQGAAHPITVVFDADGSVALRVGERETRQALGERWRPGQWQLVEVDRGPSTVRVLLDGQVVTELGDAPAEAGALCLLVAGGEAVFDDVEVGSGAYARAQAPPYTMGPYDFQTNTLVDPSDYMDFTDAEWAAIAASPDKEKLRRQARSMAVIGAGNNERAAWRYFHGSWQVADGALRGQGPASLLEHVSGFDTAAELRLRLRLESPDAVAMLAAYGEDRPLQPAAEQRHWNNKGQPLKTPAATPWLVPGEGAVVWLTAGSLPDTRALPGLVLSLPEGDTDWHDLRLVYTHDTVTAMLDQQPAQTASFTRAAGTTLRLGVQAGTVAFDNAEVAIPRRSPHDWVSAFDRRETAWWREGQWIDHSGIACVLASNWVSLVAPDGAGRMRHKASVSDHVRVTAHVEEYSEWYGWDQKNSHSHFAFDNIELGLVDPATDAGYLLTVNAENHDTAILSRAGVELQRVLQPRQIMAYRGGHSPYHPRRADVCLERRGGLLIARLNGVEILRATDPEPLAAATQVIVGGQHTRLNVARVEIHELPRP